MAALRAVKPMTPVRRGSALSTRSKRREAGARARLIVKLSSLWRRGARDAGRARPAAAPDAVRRLGRRRGVRAARAPGGGRCRGHRCSLMPLAPCGGRSPCAPRGAFRARLKARALRCACSTCRGSPSRPSSPDRARDAVRPRQPTDGSSYERPARWLVDRAIRIEPHIHVVDRSRELAARALGYVPHGAKVFGLPGRGRRRSAGARWCSCTARRARTSCGPGTTGSPGKAHRRRRPCARPAARRRCRATTRRAHRGGDSGRRRRSGHGWRSTRWSTGYGRGVGRDRRRQRTPPRRGGARPAAARAALQRPDAVAHRAGRRNGQRRSGLPAEHAPRPVGAGLGGVVRRGRAAQRADARRS